MREKLQRTELPVSSAPTCTIVSPSARPSWRLKYWLRGSLQKMCQASAPGS